MPTSRSPFGPISLIPFPNFQDNINKQVSFLNTIQQMQRRAAGISGGGGRVPRDENGLTPWQQAQMDYKLRKDAEKAAEADAKKNVMLGLDPVTKEPIIYRNESGQNLTQKDRDRLLADELQRRLKNAAGQDVELNKALGELNSGTELSTQRRSELQRVVRDRTKALGREYGIDDRATFDAIIGPSKQILDEQRQALRNDSFLDTVWAGMRKGGNALYYALASPWPWVSDADRLENARKMREEQEAITRSSPTLQERALVEAEAAREGKDVGYMQAAQANLASNIGASVADTVTSFAPAIAAGMIPIVGTYAGPALAGGIGAGLNQVSQAARVEADPNLTEAQKQQALSYSDPGFVATTGVGGVTGLLMPGGVGSGAARLAGRGAAALGAKAGSKGVGSRLVAAGERAAERANAPRSLAALSRDVPVNMAENAGLMAANTVGANVAYNMSTGQPLTQGAMEGVGRAAMEGAIVGVPFGIGRTLRRRSAPRVQATTEGAAPASTPEPQQTAVETSRQLDSWRAELSKAVNAKTVDEAAANRLIAEYLDAGTPETVSSRLDELRNIPVGKGLTPKGKRAIGDLIKNYWEGALNDGTIAEKIASNYQRPAEGESRLASYMGELERARAKRAAGQDTRDDSSMETDSAKRASDAASGDSVQDDASNSETPGGGVSRPAAQTGRQTQTPSAASPQEGREGTPASQQPANAGSPRPSSVEAGDGTRVVTLAPKRGDGSKSNAATTSGSEQPVSWTIIPETLKGADGKPHKDAYINGAGKQFETVINQTTGIRYAKVNGKWRRLDGKKSYPATLAAQAEIRNVLEVAERSQPNNSRAEWSAGETSIEEGTGKNKITRNYVSLTSLNGETYLGDTVGIIKDKNGVEYRNWTRLNGTKREKLTKKDPTSNELSELYHAKMLEAAKSTNPKGEIRESRALREPRQTEFDDVRQHLISRSYQGYNGSRDEVIRELPDGSFVEYRDVTVDDDPVTVFHLNRLYVAPESRGKGVSKALEQWAMKRIAKEHPNAVLYAEAEPFTPDATLSMEQLLRSYEKRGAVEIPNSKGETFSPDRLLDPNKPLSQQPKYVREHLKDVKLPSSRPLDISDTATGNQIFDKILDRWLNLYAPAASALHEAGIYFQQCGIPIKFEIRNGKIVKPSLSAFDYKYVLGGDEPSFRGWWESTVDERRYLASRKLSPEVIDAYLTSPSERKLAAQLNRTAVDSPKYQELLQQFVDTMLRKFKGIKNRSALLSSKYPGVSEDTLGWYDPNTKRIGLDPGNIYDRYDTVENALHSMSHEIGHNTLDIGVPSSVRTAISMDALNSADKNLMRSVDREYGNLTPERLGEELFVEQAALDNPFLDPVTEMGYTNPREYAEDMVSMTLDGLGTNNADNVAAARELIHFLSTNAPSEIGSFGDIATLVLTNNKAVVEAFTNPNVQTTGLLQELASDYRNKVQEAGLKGYSKETMADYLSAVLDPRTSMDVYARTTKLC